MPFLDGFIPFNFDEGVAYVSVTKNGVTFNKSVVIKLDYPEYVLLLIDNSSKRIAVQCCNSDVPNAYPFFKKKESKVVSVRWNSRDLLNTLCNMMNWNLENSSYRVDGLLLKEESAMVFDLSSAVELV